MEKENLQIIDTKSNAIISSEENVVLATGYTQDDINKLYSEAKSNVDDYDKKRVYNAYTDSTTTTTLTNDDISRLSQSPQDNISLAKEIGSYVRTFITKNDLIGKTYDSICNNINTDYTLSYVNYDENRNKNKKLENAKSIIINANEDINVKHLIRESVTSTFADGTYIFYLDGDVNGWCIDYFPLGIATVTPYLKGGTPYIAIDMNELKQKVKPSSDYKDKNRKNKFFENIEDLIKNTYPEEVYQAYKNGEKYAILNPERTGVMRVNNLNRKYGVSPIFRAFEPLIKLETYDASDAVISKAKAKKIIFQQLDSNYFTSKTDTVETDIMNKATLAHAQLMAAWSNPTVLYTGLPWVKDVKYVEPNATPTPIETLNYNRNKIFTALGITFLRDTNTSATSGQLSVKELLKCINGISEQLETILEKFYKFILKENNIETIYAPKVKVVDSEQLDSGLKKDIATFLFQVMGCSYDTAYHIFGINAKDEAAKRQSENENGYVDTFMPRTTGYTTNGDQQIGHPLDKNSKNPDKQLEDKAKNDDK